MKNLDRRYKAHLSTLGSARSVSSMFILAGLLFIFTAFVFGYLLLQAPAQNQDAVLEAVAILDENSSDSEETVSAPTDTATTIKSHITQLLLKLEWSHIFAMLVGALGLIWFGYVLRVLTIVGETQLVVFPDQD